VSGVWQKEIGRRERRNGKEFLVHIAGIIKFHLKFNDKPKLPLSGSV
jgi:hypothetical protein